jgi:hypothetical protein
MFNCESTSFDEFDLLGYTNKQLAEITENGNRMIKVAEDRDDPFDEFTRTICPAYKAAP